MPRSFYVASRVPKPDYGRDGNALNTGLAHHHFSDPLRRAFLFFTHQTAHPSPSPSTYHSSSINSLIMFSRLATVFVFALSAIYASAAISIIAPSADYWWVAESQNLYSWTCGASNNGGFTNFTVLLNNANPATFHGPQALVSIQWDYDCSVLLPATDVAGIAAGTGYTLSFANVYNQTDVIATSAPFEIKAIGSAYAPQPSGVASATVTAGANQTGTASTSTASSTTTAKSSAMATYPAAAGLITGVMALVGATLMM
ncbi:hypothetical protein FRB95_011780 [Tulasnella sp. JGI-2019a]|nr:hypothetical protein FRB95_011780 [Tulasnella sp. JGI-2019a]